jgi:hypothetical protein
VCVGSLLRLDEELLREDDDDDLDLDELELDFPSPNDGNLHMSSEIHWLSPRPGTITHALFLHSVWDCWFEAIDGALFGLSPD